VLVESSVKAGGKVEELARLLPNFFQHSLILGES